jgi:predicted RNA-binding protein YlqC (UPF0109 family)
MQQMRKEIKFATEPSTSLQITIKLLVSSAASGAVLGKSGRTVSELQEKSQSRIKLSQRSNHYPGGHAKSRVCLFQGRLANVKAVVERVVTKLYEFEASQQVNDETEISQQCTLRLLVPASSCGLLIGRDGANIKHLKNDSSVTQIQISPKQSEGMLLALASERIMTITGPTLQCCVCCVHLVLMDMSLNPELFRYTNMTSKSIPAAPPMSVYPIRANNVNDSSLSYSTATFNQPGQEDSPLLHVPCIETYCLWRH